jgi:hypothetical protein
MAFKRLRVTLFPLVAGSGVLALYALAEGNIGTAFRHRGEFVWVVALLAAMGAFRIAERYRKRPDSPGGDRALAP